MHTLMNTIKALNQNPGHPLTATPTKTIAENIFRDLRSYGLRDKDIVAVSSELLSRLTVDIRARQIEDSDAVETSEMAPAPRKAAAAP